MNAFTRASTVETRGNAILLPYIGTLADDGRYIVTEKGKLSKLLQKMVGDVILNRDGVMLTVENKIEEKHTGNVFLEIFSNRNLDFRENHAEHGTNPGWMQTSRADFLFYYFLDTDSLYIFDLFALQQWAFGTESKKAHIFCWPLLKQGKYVQRNDTWGFIVDIEILKRDLLGKLRVIDGLLKIKEAA